MTIFNRKELIRTKKWDRNQKIEFIIKIKFWQNTATSSILDATSVKPDFNMKNVKKQTRNNMEENNTEFFLFTNYKQSYII